MAPAASPETSRTVPSHTWASEDTQSVLTSIDPPVSCGRFPGPLQRRGEEDPPPRRHLAAAQGSQPLTGLGVGPSLQVADGRPPARRPPATVDRWSPCPPGRTPWRPRSATPGPRPAQTGRGAASPRPGADPGAGGRAATSTATAPSTSARRARRRRPPATTRPLRPGSRPRAPPAPARRPGPRPGNAAPPPRRRPAVQGVQPARLLLLRAVEQGPGVLQDRFEHAVPGPTVPSSNDTSTRECSTSRSSRPERVLQVGGDRLDRVQRAAAGERPTAAAGAPVPAAPSSRWLQSRVARMRALPGGQVRGPGARHRVVQPVQQRGGVEHPGMGRSELERQRDPGQPRRTGRPPPPARRGRQPNVGRHRAGAGEQQRAGGRGLDLGQVARPARAGGRAGARRTRPRRAAAAPPGWWPARRRPGHSASNRATDAGAPVSCSRLSSTSSSARPRQLAASTRRRRAVLDRRLAGDPADGRQQQRGVARAWPAARRPRRRGAPRRHPADLQGQPGLADPAGAGQRHQPGAGGGRHTPPPRRPPAPAAASPAPAGRGGSGAVGAGAAAGAAGRRPARRGRSSAARSAAGRSSASASDRTVCG